MEQAEFKTIAEIRKIFENSPESTEFLKYSLTSDSCEINNDIVKLTLEAISFDFSKRYYYIIDKESVIEHFINKNMYYREDGKLKLSY